MTATVRAFWVGKSRDNDKPDKEKSIFKKKKIIVENFIHFYKLEQWSSHFFLQESTALPTELSEED